MGPIDKDLLLTLLGAVAIAAACVCLGGGEMAMRVHRRLVQQLPESASISET